MSSPVSCQCVSLQIAAHSRLEHVAARSPELEQVASTRSALCCIPSLSSETKSTPRRVCLSDLLQSGATISFRHGSKPNRIAVLNSAKPCSTQVTRPLGVPSAHLATNC